MLSVKFTFQKSLVQVESNGDVTFTRLFRLRAAMEPNINAYPYDTQMPTIKIASTGYSTQKVQVGFNFDDDALYLEKIK